MMKNYFNSKKYLLNICITNQNHLKKLSKVISMSVSIANLTTKDNIASLVWKT